MPEGIRCLSRTDGSDLSDLVCAPATTNAFVFFAMLGFSISSTQRSARGVETSNLSCWRLRWRYHGKLLRYSGHINDYKNNLMPII
jgi:hypothetical protein